MRGDRLDAGFSLLEALVGILLLTVAVVAAVPLVLHVLQATAELDARRTAVTLASERLEQVRGVRPSQLVAGRHAADVAALVASPGLVDLSREVTATGNSDPTAASGSPAATVPLTQQQSVHGVTFTLETYVDVCYLSSTGSSGSTCTADASNGTREWRVSVDVSWPRTPGTHCASARPGRCEHVASTLVDPSTDPVFSTDSPPTVTSLLDTRTSPAAALGVVHPGQLVPLRVVGTAFSPGAGAYGNNRDAVGQPTGVTATSLDVPLLASGLLGRRSLTVVNPSGTSSAVPFDVTTSTPTITGMSPTSGTGGVPVQFTLTGSDLFSTPSLATQTVRPSVQVTGVAVINGAPYYGSGQAAMIKVVDPTTLTFMSQFPVGVYTATVTVVVVNPDGGTATATFTVYVT